MVEKTGRDGVQVVQRGAAGDGGRPLHGDLHLRGGAAAVDPAVLDHLLLQLLWQVGGVCVGGCVGVSGC